MGCCKHYCMGLSLFSTFFLLYLCYIVGSGSKTLYIEVHDNASSAVALFIAAIIYAGIFGYLYYDIYVNVDRKEELRRWVMERKRLNELRELDVVGNDPR